MEYKTYRCDRCDKFNAIHIRIPNVDNNSGDTADGVVDLCPRCVEEFLPRVFMDQDISTVCRFRIWRQLIGI